jgi:hypothetical protein
VLWTSAAQAAVDATVDRDRIALGDTLRLTVSATEDDEDLSGVDLTGLQRDFEILQRSTRSNTTIVNGRRTHNRQLVMEITPLRTGMLQIPSLRVGARRTDAIDISVSEPVQLDPGDSQVLFEAELDRDQVYVQGQAVLTVRLQQAINLDNRSISELDLPDSFVVPLEQQSFQRTVGGRPWLVHEVRYAIFPEQSGTLEIPALTFSARESRPRRSLFDSTAGRVVRMRTQPLSVEVLPRPEAYPDGATWLPARTLTLEESWSAEPEQLEVGASVTRTVRLRGEGLQGAQLPPLETPRIDGLKFYPDQPDIGDAELPSGLLGTRTDSTAIVPTAAGTVLLPEVRVPWWDTESGTLRFATLPARTLTIAPAARPAATQQPGAATVTSDLTATPSAAGGARTWQIATAVCALGWLVTLLLWLRPQAIRQDSAPEAGEQPSRKAAYRQLIAACTANHAAQARQWFIRWSAAAWGDPEITSATAAAARWNTPELDSALQALEASLYAPAGSAWRGDTLAEIIRELDQRPRHTVAGETGLAPLYPGERTAT